MSPAPLELRSYYLGKPTSTRKRRMKVKVLIKNNIVPANYTDLNTYIHSYMIDFQLIGSSIY